MHPPAAAGSEAQQRLEDRLRLTEAQKAQVRPILREDAEKVKAARTKHEGDTSRRGRRKLLKERGGVPRAQGIAALQEVRGDRLIDTVPIVLGAKAR